jgi:cytochrome c
MKKLLLYKPFHIIFVALLLCCFVTKSFAVAIADDVQPVHKEIIALKTFVDSGLKYIKQKGAQAAYKEFDNPKGLFRKGNQYIFVYGYNGKVLAYGSDPKELVGKNLFNGKDKFGTPYFQLFVEAARRGGGVVSYYWPRPDTGVLQYKTSYIIPVDDKTFIGAGIYKALEVQKSQEVKINELKKFVDSGAEYIKKMGAEEAYKEFNKPQGKFVKDDWYIFVIKHDGLLPAHGGNPKKMVGSNLTEVTDEFGTPLMLLFIEAAKSGGGVVSYYWPHYVEGGNIRFKTSYILPLDSQTFIGAGYYGD